ncbi:DUF7302 family protein [Leifsonia poae]|uniref:DUF7302 family protein n=1 Tax=Leifsonia poae TaxID=110933 RepID=UPI001CBEFBCC|nr:hypothetical protein [Leifsonia poae]
MPRLRNAGTGAVMSVSDEIAERLGPEWVDADKAETPRSDTPDASWKVSELKAYADEHGIDLGKAKSKPEILAAVAGHTGDDDTTDGDDDSDDQSDDDTNE